MFLVFSVFTATGGELTPKNLFTTLSLLITLRLSSVDITILNILSISDIKVAITRLQVYKTLIIYKQCGVSHTGMGRAETCSLLGTCII